MEREKSSGILILSVQSAYAHSPGKAWPPLTEVAFSMFSRESKRIVSTVSIVVQNRFAIEGAPVGGKDVAEISKAISFVISGYSVESIASYESNLTVGSLVKALTAIGKTDAAKWIARLPQINLGKRPSSSFPVVHLEASNEIVKKTPEIKNERTESVTRIIGMSAQDAIKSCVTKSLSILLVTRNSKGHLTTEEAALVENVANSERTGYTISLREAETILSITERLINKQLLSE